MNLNSKFYSTCIILQLITVAAYCQTSKFTKKNTSAGNEFLFISSDKSYNYTWYRFMDIGPIKDTINHIGTWVQNGDTLILNSYSKPTKYDLMEVTEKTDNNSDSIVIIVNPKDSIPFFFISPTSVRINDKHFKLSKPKGNYLRYSVPNMPSFQLRFIILYGYPIYYPKNQRSNIFEFSIKELSETKDMFPINTYFVNERFLVKGDTLFQLDDNKINTSNYLIKELK